MSVFKTLFILAIVSFSFMSTSLKQLVGLSLNAEGCSERPTEKGSGGTAI